MKKILLMGLAIALMLMVVSCAAEAFRNKQNVGKLKKGMTKDEVVAVMGEPVKGEVYCMPDAMFYYTDPKWSDGNITSDECTPLVFEKDKLIGWGQEFYKEYRQKDWK